MSLLRELTALLLLGFVATACGKSKPAGETAASPSLATEEPVLVDVRWKLGLDGTPQRRAVWVSGDDEVAGTRWQEFELGPSADDGAASWYLRCTRYRDHCYALSEEAFDRLQSASQGVLPADEFVREYGRKDHLVVPSPDLSRVVVAHWREGQRGIIELPSLRQAGWPPDLPWGSGHKAVGLASWSGDGSRLAFVTADEVQGSLPIVRIVVIDAVRGLTLHNITMKRWVIELAWSPDGARLAVLAADNRLGSGPIESLFAMIGHGRPYKDLYVQIFDLSSGEMTEHLLARDLAEASAHIHWDPKAVAARTNWEEP